MECFLNLIENFQATNQQINITHSQKIASALSSKCETSSATILKSRGFSSLDRINYELLIGGFEWELDPMEDSAQKPQLKSYPEICIYATTKNAFFFQDSELGPYGNYTSGNYFSYNHPLMAIAKTNHIISAGFGGVVINGISLDDFKNKCGNGEHPMITAISQKLLITKSEHANSTEIESKIFVRNQGKVLETIPILIIVCFFINSLIYQMK